MKIVDLHEYGSSGPYIKSSGTTAPVTTPSAGAKNLPGSTGQPPGLPAEVKKVLPIKTVKDLPKPDKTDPKKPFGVYDQKKRLIAIAVRPKPNMPPVMIDPKSKKPMQNLRGLYIQDPRDPNATQDADKMESVFDKFLKLSLEEQLRVVESIDVEKLNRILNENK